MKLSAKSAAWLLPLLLTACFHKTARRPVQAFPPLSSSSPKPETTPVALPPSAVTIPSQPLAAAPDIVAQDTKPPVRHRKPKSPQTTADGPSAPASNQQASNGSPAVSAIGQLSSGDPADMRRETADSINAIERALNGIEPKLTDQRQKTAMQIREYLKQARVALASGDVDGAHTLAAKAKVLLSELSD